MKSIEQRNKEYHAMSNNEKKVAIATDVINSMASGTFIAHGGSYGKIANISQEDLINGMECVGCAKAGLVYSRIKLGNDYTNINEVASDRTPIKEFTKDEWTLIEVVFERYLGHHIVKNSPHRYKFENIINILDTIFYHYCRTYPVKYSVDTLIMYLIMQDIIDNKGEIKLHTITFPPFDDLPKFVQNSLGDSKVYSEVTQNRI